MQLELQTKDRGQTVWLDVEYTLPADQAELDAVRAAVASIGWAEDPHHMRPLPSGWGHTFFYKEGTGLFGGWMPSEKHTYLSELRQALLPRRLGRVRYLTLADLL
jgi:hypothetical protein